MSAPPMRTMGDAAFPAWLAEGGIANRARDPRQLVLEYAAGGLRRTWAAPEGAQALARWRAAVVRAASAQGPWWIRRRYGGGWDPRDAPLPEPEKLVRAASAAGVPPELSGALGFGAGERELLMAFVDAFTAWTWTTREDLCLIPDDRSCVVMFCHDEEIHAEFPDSGRLEAFRRALGDWSSSWI